MIGNIDDLLLVHQSQQSQEPYYEVLEYIQLDGTQYFDTGVLGNSDTKIEAGIELLPSNQNYYIFGARGNASTSTANINNIDCISAWGNLMVDFNNSSYNSYRLSIAASNLAIDTAYDVVINKNKREVFANGISKGSNTTVCNDTFNSVNSICIGIVNAANIANYTNFNGRIRYFKIDGKDYIPVLDRQLIPCLYDRVSKTFLYHQNSSGFSVPTYKRWNKFDVDYIESSGTQYIDSGFKFTNTSAFELTCAKVGNYSDSSVYCGARNNTDATTNARVLDYLYNSPQSVLNGTFIILQRGGYDIQNNAFHIPYDNNFHTYYESPMRMSIDDMDRQTVPSLISPNLNFYIFCQNVGTATSVPNKSSIKVKSCKLWDNNILVRSFQPVVWHNGNTTAVACLYDEVYNKMYTNAGTGSLKAYVVDSNDVVYEVGSYISGSPEAVSGASNCFDTGIYGNENTQVKLLINLLNNQIESGQLFGSYDGPESTSQNYTINSIGSSGTRAPIRFDGATLTNPIKKGITKVSIVDNKKGIWVDNALHGNWGTVNSFTTTTTLLILKANNSSNVRPNGCCYCTIEEDFQLIAEYIPVRNASDNSIFGLYDRVSGQLNRGIGTLTFNALD